LSHLTTIGNNLYLRYNTKLTTLEGMEQVQSIRGKISFYDNDKLSSLSGLSGVNRVDGGISIYRNNSLDSLGFLNSVDTIKGDININNNHGLTKLGAFGNVLHLDGEIGLIDNPAMRNLSAFQRLKGVKDDFGIVKSPLLTSIDELDQLTFIGASFYIGECGITSLSGLSNLRSADQFSIYSNDSLSSFDGLDVFEHVGKLIINGKNIENLDVLTSLMDIRILWINDCPKLRHLPVLDKIHSLDEYIHIGGCDKLRDLSGLDSLEEVNGSLTIWGNTSLTSLHGLEKLKVCGDGLILNSNNSLENLNFLENLTQTNGPVVIRDNALLVNIDGLRNLLPDHIHASSSFLISIEIIGNTSLTACSIEPVCNKLSTRISEVQIYNNAAGCNSPTQVMVDCDFPSSCQDDGLFITSQVQIDDFFITYPGCTFIKGDVVIREEEQGNITNLLGLKAIKTIGGSLTIVENSALEQLTGLDSVKIVGGVIKISDNEHLFSIDALNNIDPVYINTKSFEEYPFIITGNSNLSVCSIQPLCYFLVIPNVKVDIQGNSYGCSDKQDAIDGCGFPTECYLGTILDQRTIDEFPVRYPKCTELTGRLAVFRDPQHSMPSDPILTLAPLSQITTLHGGLLIRNINDLVDLTGLENLENVNGTIEISFNPVLESLDGLSGINPASVFESASIYDNVSLNDCAVESICRLLEQDEILNIGIARNGADCIKAKVKAQCLVSVTDLPGQASIKIYPNPTTGLIQIETIPDMDTENAKIGIYDLSGREIKTIEFENSISIGDLDSGLYILVIRVLNKAHYYSRVFLTD
ncbi:MAG: T9SS type A sorting domain-containing protein, partial [Saprospiraceae bacterium]